MGLTSQSTGAGVLNEMMFGDEGSNGELVIALAGNPNVGKSTVFNSLTGLKQHTGNWPGKTVTCAWGRYKHKDRDFILVDIPGTYSLMSNSAEEEIARNFVCFGQPDATIVVADATCLERNLNLVLQILEITGKVVVCVNLIDEAKRKNIHIDIKRLSDLLGVPVVATSARNKVGLKELMDAVYEVAVNDKTPSQLKVKYDEAIEDAIKIMEPFVAQITGNRIDSRWVSLKLLDGDNTILKSLSQFLGKEFSEDKTITDKIAEAREYLNRRGIEAEYLRDNVVSSIIHHAENICSQTVTFQNNKYNDTDRKIDKIVTSRIFGIPIMVLLLAVIFWITIVGANVPSRVISWLLFGAEEQLTKLFLWLGAPDWLHGILVKGMYRTLAWVVSVMLPPMAIFFPLFTLLEDLGYLPRVAFNLDNFFKKACAHGKQALTMCMGFGCNAAGVIGCRIIDSPRERLIAIITNNFVPCNGRFPTLIAMSAIFIGGTVSEAYRSVVSTAAVICVILLGILMTLFMSKILSKTILKGMPSSFTLELPPYRKPQIGRIIIHSIFDRTIFVLGRAVAVAAPAGLVIWFLANINIGGMSLLAHGAEFLEPFANLIGLDGYILMAFILGLPANEIVIPIVIMSYMATGNLTDLSSLDELRNLLVSHGWTWLTALCVMLFSLMHFPCGTTLWTIRKETKSLKWTLASFLVPLLAGIVFCFGVTTFARLLKLVP